MTAARQTSGNVLVFILVAIFLMGALTMLLVRTDGQTEDTGETEKASVLASEMVRYTTSIKNAIDNLRARGCSESEISFWTDDNDDGSENSSDRYFNPSSPTDRSCHVFDVKGAGMTFKKPGPAVLKGGTFPRYMDEYVYSGLHCIGNVGTGGDYNDCWNNGTSSDAELAVFVLDVRDDVCRAINRMADYSGIDVMPASHGNFYEEAEHVGRFKGSYGLGGNVDVHIAAPASNGKASFCVLDESPDTNIFYQVLIAR